MAHGRRCESGAVRWKFAARKPILAGVTPTAGDVVFAADAGGVFYAFDATLGKYCGRRTSVKPLPEASSHTEPAGGS